MQHHYGDSRGDKRGVKTGRRKLRHLVKDWCHHTSDDEMNKETGSWPALENRFVISSTQMKSDLEDPAQCVNYDFNASADTVM